MKITEEEIKRISSAAIYRRGLEYFKEGRVHLFVRDEHELVSVVDGEEVYNVSVRLDDDGKVVDSFCTCPYYSTMDCTCKHIVATLKLRQKELAAGAKFIDENDRLAKELCSSFSEENAEKIHLNLAVTLRINEQPAGRIKYSIALAVGEGVPELIGGVESFLAAFAGEGKYKLSKFRSFSREKYAFSENDEQILSILSESCQNRAANSMYVQKHSATEIGAITAKRLMPYLIKARTEFIVNDLRLVDMQIREENPDIPIDVRATDRTVTLSVTESGFALVPDGSWFLFSGDIYHTDKQWRSSYIPVYRVLNGGARTQVEFSGENRIAFASSALPMLKKLSGAVFQGVDDIVVDEKPKFDVYFDCRSGAINAVIIANYGNVGLRMPYAKTENDNMIILRDPNAENAVMKYFSNFHLSDSGYLLDDSDEIYRFLFCELAELEKIARIIESDSFATLRDRQSADISAKVNYNKDIDLLEVSFESSLSDDEIAGVLAAVRLRQSYYRNDKGRFIRLDSDDEIARLLTQLGFDDEDARNGRKLVSKYHALYLDGLAKKGKVGSDKAFDKLIESVRSLKAEIPEELNSVLREYQKEAVHWMTQLDEFGFGGILADDMGLGKTLEVIAFVMSRKHDKPALVVAPSALLYNWLNEIKRFAPDAKAAIIDGNKQERAQKIAAVSDEDFVITSYPLLRRDGELYKNRQFAFCFIDEAQYIKNPKTMNARGVKQINAKSKFALTGTPVENSLMELWSIFDFLMPGYLGKRRSFAENYDKPVNQGFDYAAEMLKSRIKPFVMRRMKRDVLEELPEKIENTVFAELVPEQRKLYEAYLAIARREVDRILAEGESDMMILSLLTRLRQICCHPALFDESYDKESGKLELLCELVSSAVLGGHRVLVFSQFTSMLKIIREEFAKRGLSAFYLDGSTPPYERAELADRFNSGEREVFLISLKAGGTGLNLTGADMVIHYDPWWNPAVTDQASDRAYRIGQTRAVHVIRLAASGTIEEQILKLQDKKRALADGIIIKNSATLSNLSNEEILSLFGG